jgi:hypothetical protein
MKWIRIALTLAVVMGLTFGTAGIAAAGDDYKKDDGKKKVTICHRPPGNPSNGQTITIGKPAVKSHLENHKYDRKGPCKKKKH